MEGHFVFQRFDDAITAGEPQMLSLEISDLILMSLVLLHAMKTDILLKILVNPGMNAFVIAHMDLDEVVGTSNNLDQEKKPFQDHETCILSIHQ